MLRAEELQKISRGETIVSFFPTGAIASLMAGSVRINQMTFLPHELPLTNVWVRLHLPHGQAALFPLLDPTADARVSRHQEGIRVRRELAGGVRADVRFTLHTERTWSWAVTLEAGGDGENSGPLSAEFLFTQDIGLADEGGLLNNELYMAQYLDIRARRHEDSYVLEYRENLTQGGGRKPALQVGVRGADAFSFATDQMQFLGPETRALGLRQAVEAALDNPERLPSEVRQYELPMAVLRTERETLGDKPLSIVFYNHFEPDLPQGLAMDGLSLEVPEFRLPRLHPDDAETAAAQEAQEEEVSSGTFASREFAGLLRPLPIDEKDLDGFYPKREMEEFYGEELGAFFTPDGVHVMLPAKGTLMERPGAHMLLRNMETERIDSNVIASTNFGYGLFNSQVLVGNSNYHKLLSKNAGQLNLSHGTGQRIYLRRRDGWKLLAGPSAYEMGLNYSRWLYLLEDDCIEVRCWVAFGENRIRLEVQSRDGKKYDFLLTQELALGESAQADHYDRQENPDGSGWTFTLKEGTFSSQFYPDLNFRLTLEGTAEALDDGIFYEDGKPRMRNFLVNRFHDNHFAVVIEGNAEQPAQQEEEGAPAAAGKSLSFEKTAAAYRSFYRRFLNDMELKLPERAAEKDKLRVQKLHLLAPWYVHDALVHFISPHGIEQAEGAAWGTRDVCQGPFELFMATGHFALVRELLLRVFSHQLIDTKEWPQWFMFDRYTIFAGESHGDVVFWPLKALGEYILRTGDRSILAQHVPYITVNHQAGDPGEATVLEHAKLAIESIRERSTLIPGLVNYAGGDWDDTLQPASEEAKEQMISAWTAALSYQVVRTLAEALKITDDGYAGELNRFADEMKTSFTAHMIVDGVIPGFLRHEGERNTYILHPRDEITHIKYRLLPLSRSIIAGIVDREQAEQNFELIARELRHKDGARLMSSPVPYTSGNPTIFQRAEQATNVGREVSLQYVHAHIRYIEALCKGGRGAEAWKAIHRIVPIRIEDEVPNALPHQSNVYFSSSDPDVKTRFEFSERYGELKEGKVGVRGGWRLYSSGPGIFLNQVISSFLGLELRPDGLRINPAVPPELDDFKLSFRYWDQEITIVFTGLEAMAGEEDSVLTVEKGRFLPQNDIVRMGNAQPLTIEVLSVAKGTD